MSQVVIDRFAQTSLPVDREVAALDVHHRYPHLSYDADIHHQMHHRYFECNYGSLEIPWDKFFGSFHDGTVEADKRMKERRIRMMGN